LFVIQSDYTSNLTSLPPNAKEQAMTTQEFHVGTRQPSAAHHNTDADPDGLSVPYTGQTRMRLTITSGLADARIRIDPDATELIAIDCGDRTRPHFRVSASELRVSWPRPATLGSWLRAALGGECRDIEIVLHPAVEWTLRIRGGLSSFDADLASGHLAQLEISGGISDARLDLPPACGVVPIRISGGVSDLAIRRPGGTGVALAVNGGISELQLDEQGFGAIGGGARLASGHVQGDVPRYAVEISGGASGLSVIPRRASAPGVEHLA
jgi:hypothetical protein